MADLQNTLEDPRRRKLITGEQLAFPDPPKDREETAEEKAARTIPANWIAELAAFPARIVEVPVRIHNAIISGQLNLKYATYRYELVITGSRFEERVNFSFGTFKRTVQFDGSVFAKEVNFRAAHAQGDFEVTGCEFADGALFQDIHVDEVLDSRGATFGKASFDRIEIGKSAFFGSVEGGGRTTFGGDVRFVGANFHGNADFIGADFEAEAAFDGVKIDGDAVFSGDKQGQSVTFGGDTRFLGADVRGQVSFVGAEFKASAAFDGMKVGGDAFFRSDENGKQVTFDGDARFLGAEIHGDAEFRGVAFNGTASFDGMRIDGHAFFCTDKKNQRSTFVGKARFMNVHIHGQLSFAGAEFKSVANFDFINIGAGAYFRPDDTGQEVTFGGTAIFSIAVFESAVQFIGAEFKNGADFENCHFRGAADFDFAEFLNGSQATFIGTKFDHGVSFDDARFSGETDFTAANGGRDINFLRTVFGGPLSFREAHLEILHFGDSPGYLHGTDRGPTERDPMLQDRAQFNGGVDLRGLTYERIDVNLGDLLPRVTPFDRQPYTQLESRLRTSGEDVKADRVYLVRRREERKRVYSEKHYFSWLADWIYNLGANYGVRPYRLLGFTLAFIFLGAFAFHQPGALRPKEKETVLGESLSSASAQRPSFERALGVSIREFLPIDVPVGADWVPSVGRWSAFGVFLRIVGAILVGVGIGAMTGLLRRVER